MSAKAQETAQARQTYFDGYNIIEGAKEPMLTWILVGFMLILARITVRVIALRLKGVTPTWDNIFRGDKKEQ